MEALNTDGVCCKLLEFVLNFFVTVPLLAGFGLLFMVVLPMMLSLHSRSKIKFPLFAVVVVGVGFPGSIFQ